MVTGLFIRYNQDDPLPVDHQIVGDGELRQIGPGSPTSAISLSSLSVMPETRIGRHSELAPIVEDSSERRSIRDISYSRG